jgi:hypothetical protein
MHSSAEILFHRPRTFDVLDDDVPEEVKTAWETFINEKEKYFKILEKHGII